MVEYILTKRDGNRFSKELLRKRIVESAGKTTEKWESNILDEIKDQIEAEMSNKFATKEELKRALEMIQKLMDTTKELTDSITKLMVAMNKQKLEEAKKQAKPEGIIAPPQRLTIEGFEHLRGINWNDPRAVKAYLESAENEA
jgi:hypothetical protein